MSEEENNVKKLAKKLEKQLDQSNIINNKYIEQNFHMKKEQAKFERMMQQKVKNIESEKEEKNKKDI